MSLRAAWTWLAVLCLVGLIVLLNLDDLVAIAIALASLGLVAAYPFMKRITWWPQAWLGMVFSWAALVGWAAARHEAFFTAPFVEIMAPCWLYAGTIFWVIGYDTIYALQDIEDDALAGVKSTRARAGTACARRSRALSMESRVLVLGGGAVERAAAAARARRALPVAVHLARQVARLRADDGADALGLFRSNRLAGMLMFAGCLVVGSAP